MDAQVDHSLVCRHFMNGFCRFGTRCRYLHEWPVSASNQICRYFQKGICWYGERCRYFHVQPAGNSGVPGRRSSAPHVHPSSFGNVHFNRRGSEPVLPQAQVTSNRQYPSSSVGTVSNRQRSLRHTTSAEVTSEGGSQDQCHEEAVRSLQTFKSGVPYNHVQQAKEPSSMDAVESRAAAALDGQQDFEALCHSKGVTCGICMDVVYEKPSASERRFGILPNCSHVFCLRCIITWRKTKDLQEDVIKSCPQCRVKSAFYIPHNYWVEGDAKDVLVASFKERCSKIICSYFMRHGSCPFKSECIYLHDEVQQRPSTHLHTMTLELDDLHVLDNPQLLDLIIAMAIIVDDDDEDFFSDYDL